MGYEFLEHTADVRFRATGETLADLLASAGEALTASMIDLDTVREEETRPVEAEGEDLEELLFDWLDELIFLFSAHTFVTRKLQVEPVEKRGGEYRARGTAAGEEADLERHAFETEVKAVSYHGMEVEETDAGWEATVILDV